MRDDHFTIKLPNWPARSRRLIPDDAYDHGQAFSFDAVVTKESPLNLRGCAYTLAKFFRREFHYDFVQYGIETNDDDARDRVYLWKSRQRIDEFVIGAACFRWRDWDNHPHGYALAWVWFHPYARSQGYFSGSWKWFQKCHGEFWVETPLSSAMERFLEIHGWPNKEQHDLWKQAREQETS